MISKMKIMHLKKKTNMILEAVPKRRNSWPRFAEIPPEFFFKSAKYSATEFFIKNL
jgi:hypothetical protein